MSDNFWADILKGKMIVSGLKQETKDPYNKIKCKACKHWQNVPWVTEWNDDGTKKNPIFCENCGISLENDQREFKQQKQISIDQARASIIQLKSFSEINLAYFYLIVTSIVMWCLVHPKLGGEDTFLFRLGVIIFSFTGIAGLICLIHFAIFKENGINIFDKLMGYRYDPDKHQENILKLMFKRILIHLKSTFYWVLYGISFWIVVGLVFDFILAPILSWLFDTNIAFRFTEIFRVFLDALF